MAQEDKGLVLRGLLLLGAIGVLVAFVLGFIFWRPPTPTTKHELGDAPASAPGWEVRYNAATALARRGSSAVPWTLLREMLDEKQQLRNSRVKHADGREVFDEAAARANMISALRAIAAWHEKRKEESKLDVPPELRAIYATVETLTSSPYVELKLQAEKAKATFFP